jgi:hypothetical protein
MEISKVQSLENYIPLVVLGFIVLFFVAYRSYQYVRVRRQLAQQNVSGLEVVARNAAALERIATALESIAQAASQKTSS